LQVTAQAKNTGSSSGIEKIIAGKKKLEAVEQDLTSPYENQIEPDERKTNQSVAMKIKNVSP
jgi:hypothetical protein